MKKPLLCLFLLMPLLPAWSGDAMPREVQRFIDRREGCDHMRGEMPGPGEKQRIKEVERQIRKLCTGTDRELVRLKKKYAGSPALIQALNEIEPAIEELNTPVRQR